MTFEKILPELKAGKKVIRHSWTSGEKYIFIVRDDRQKGEAINPYFLIKTNEYPTLSQYMPTSCDVLAEDWELVK